MGNFKIISKQKQARAGVLKTAHGDIQTPIYMPVGTQASVKALGPDDLNSLGAEVILGNTYHLYLRPGNKLIKKLGGLHKFMGWEGPILTDSGGFQAFSLGAMIEHGVKKVQSSKLKVKNREEAIDIVDTIGKVSKEKSDIVSHSLVKTIREKTSGESRELLRENDKLKVKRKNLDQQEQNGKSILTKITEDGVKFISHLDGSTHLLTPELSIKVQLDLGSDIVLVLDELLSPLHNQSYVKQSLKRTHLWEKRSQRFFQKNLKKSTNPGAQLFGILQGVFDQEIRQNEAKWIAQQGFDGISIGGSFGTSDYWPGSKDSGYWEGISPEERTNWAASQAIYQTIEWVTPLLPENLPRHALGIGEVQDFFECIERGIDMFDCVAPTRRARNGSLYICPKHGGNIKNKFTLSIQRSEFKDDPSPICKDCLCYTCQNFSRAYLRHLFASGEILYHRLASIHNVYFMVNLTKKIREAIINGQFDKLKKAWIK